jgi:ankyrin repeat protein
VKENSEWVDFHYQVKVCENNEEHVQTIKTTLQQHPQGAVLVNSVDGSKRSPLHLAAQRGNVELARILLEFSANINAKDSQPSSVLDLAVQHNKEDFVAFLLDQGADETAISKLNRDRFEEMKDTIKLRKDKAQKSEKKNLKRRRTDTKV